VEDIVQELKAERMEDMNISREQNKRQNHKIKIGNGSFEVVAVFRHE
jgi:hypothetical protein